MASSRTENETMSEIFRAEDHEDFVEYFIFPTNLSNFALNKTPKHHCHKKIEVIGEVDDGCKKVRTEGRSTNFEIDGEVLTRFNDLFLTINAAVLNLIEEYLWQKEPFTLRKITSNTGNGQNTQISVSKEDENIIFPYFHGLTRYGENVEDEWFIVYILLRLTEQFPDIIIRVADNDGEFLLIEAANYLPDWAESDSTCLQRVYLYRGKIHIIPIPQAVSNASLGLLSVLPKNPPTIEDAIKAITKYPEVTLASHAIQSTILERIGNYPEKMHNGFQHTNMMLPRKLVMILKSRPDFVSQAVQAFCYRDPIDMKSARFMKNFKPGGSLVKTHVRLTKIMYAMLSKQDYRPDTKIGWGFPKPTSPEFKGHNLGAKLTTGFELLLSRAKPNCSVISGKQKNKKEEETRTPDVPLPKTWLRYNEKLKAVGYYRDYLEFSKPYMELEERAKDFFLKNCESSAVSGNHDGCHHDIGDMSCCASEVMLIEDWTIHELQLFLKNIKEVDFEALKKESLSLPPDDDDSWMEVKADDFESFLESHFKAKSDPQVGEIPAKLKQFLAQKSNVEGVEVTKDPERGDGGDDDEKHEAVDFRADDFVDAMDKLLQDLHKKESEWKSSEDDSFSDDEEHLAFEEVRTRYPFSKKSKVHRLMKRMDEELARTEVGRTFDDMPSTSAAARDRQGRAAAAIASVSSSNTATPIDEEPAAPDEFDEIEAFEPVQVDLYTLKNMLESFRSQDSPFGPASNVLRSVGYDISKAKK